jgi:ParB family chromosome partitioning protein
MGERRLRAAKMAGLDKVPCVVRKLSNRERFELALIENIQREDLNAMEEALAVDGLMKEFSLTQEQAAMALGKSRSGVANVLRYLRLHDDVQSALRTGAITEGHAKILAGLSEHSEQLRLLGKIVEKGMSVRELEAVIQNENVPTKGKKGAQRREPSAEVKRYEEEFQRILGRRVEIQNAGKKGWMKFAFYSPWDLDILCKRLGLIKDEPS